MIPVSGGAGVFDTGDLCALCASAVIFCFEFPPPAVVSNSVRKLLFLCSLLLMAAPAAKGASLVVFPPENLTKVPSLNWIGEGMAVSISEQCLSPDVETIGWE